jgi:hypothetical protein
VDKATAQLATALGAAYRLRAADAVHLVREAGDSAASWTIRSIDTAGGSESSVLVRSVQSFDIGWPKP